MHKKAVFDRVRELDLEEDYVQVPSEKQLEEGAALIARVPTSLDPTTVNAFISGILSNPKNRYETQHRRCWTTIADFLA